MPPTRWPGSVSTSARARGRHLRADRDQREPSPVVIRRLLGDLRRAGLVKSRRGVGAGWSLARELGSMTLLDVYEAVEPGPLFAMHRTTPDQECVVGYGIQPAMQGVYEGIEETLRHELARVTLENVLGTCSRHLASAVWGGWMGGDVGSDRWRCGG